MKLQEDIFIRSITSGLEVKFSEAFKETMHRFDLKGADIAERSGLTAAQISLFRKGQNLRIDNLERILEAMPQEAKEYMLLLVAGNDEAANALLHKNPPAKSGDNS